MRLQRVVRWLGKLPQDDVVEVFGAVNEKFHVRGDIRWPPNHRREGLKRRLLHVRRGNSPVVRPPRRLKLDGRPDVGVHVEDDYDARHHGGALPAFDTTGAENLTARPGGGGEPWQSQTGKVEATIH